MKRNGRFVAGITLISSVVVGGCSNAPSSSRVEELISEQYIMDDGDRLASIDNFERLNGLERGERAYDVEVRYDVVFERSLKDIAQQIKSESKGSLMDEMEASMGVAGLRMQFGDFKEGDRHTMEHRVELVKTENGWELESE